MSLPPVRDRLTVRCKAALGIAALLVIGAAVAVIIAAAGPRSNVRSHGPDKSESASVAGAQVLSEPAKSGTSVSALTPAVNTTFEQSSPAPAQPAPPWDFPADDTPAEQTEELNVPQESHGDSLLASIVSGHFDEEASGMCVAQNPRELQDAVNRPDCPTVLLGNASEGAYLLEEQITIERTVTVMGHPALMPTIDAHETTRAFLVKAAGFLELKFMRVEQGQGVVRDRYVKIAPPAGTRTEGTGREDDSEPKPGQIIEVAGGSVYIESGSAGATFVGVIFLSVALDAEGLQAAIIASAQLIGGRIYGGHVYSAGDTTSFFDCVFYDAVILIPLTDQVVLGGDVLIVAGQAYFTGCSWLSIQYFGTILTVGANICVLGGVAVFSWNTITGLGVVTGAYGLGSTIFLGGGIMIITGLFFHSYTGVSHTAGLGTIFTAAGVMVITGLALENVIGVETTAGAGFFQAVGAGVLVQTGVALSQFTGPSHQQLTGANFFVGSGASINTGVATSLQSSHVLHIGQAGLSYNGAGFHSYIGCPNHIVTGLVAFIGLGNYISQDSGLLVYLNNPTFIFEGVSFFAGLGRFVFVGGGAAVLGNSPVYANNFIEYPSEEEDAPEYWIGGVTEATATGPPVFVAPGMSEEFETNTELGGAAFVARDMEVYRNADLSSRRTREKLSSFVPEVLVRAAAKLQKKYDKKLRRRRGKQRGRDTTPHVWLNGTDNRTCMYCNVGRVEGPGAGVCEGADSCEDEPRKWEAVIPSGVKFEAQHVLTGQLQLTVSGGTTVAAIDVRDALRSYLKQKRWDAHVAVFGTRVVLPQLQHHLSVRGEAFDSGGDEHAPLSYTAVLVTTKASDAEDIVSALTCESSDGTSSGACHMLAELLADHGAGVSAVTSSCAPSITVPAYNSEEMKNVFSGQAARAGGSNAVRVVHSRQDTETVTSLSIRQSYVVQLSGFPPDRVLTVQVVGSRQHKSTQNDESPRSYQIALPVKLVVKTGSDGGAFFDWEVKSIEPGTYYMKAADLTGQVFGLSTQLDVTNRRIERKLYGPRLGM